MSRRSVCRKLCGLLLVLALLFSLCAPAWGVEAQREPERREEAAGVTFTRVDDSHVTASLAEALHPEQAASRIEAESHAITDVVRVSIVLEAPSVLEQGYSVMGIAENRAADAARQQVASQQAAVTRSIERRLGETLDVQWNLTLAANIISANVRWGDLDAIRELPGVKAVVEETCYDVPAPIEDGAAEPQMTISTGMTHTGLAWSAGYTGAGTRIAIIDTGLDLDHQSFDAAAFDFAIAEDAAAEGRTVADYHLLDGAGIAAVLPELNAFHKQMNSGSAAQYYVNTKVPFGFNYIDNSFYLTHDEDSKTDHGSHVGGIAAANRYIPDGEGGFVNAAETCMVTGQAPDAQLIVMKVFGKAGGAYASDYMAAIEDAVLLGADSINLSLGSTINGFSDAEVYQEVMEGLEKAGAVVCVSAGNAYQWAYAARTNGYLYTDDVMYDTMGSPGSYTNSLTVASVNNAGQVAMDSLSYLENGVSHAMAYSETSYSNEPLVTLDTSADGSGTEYDYVLVESCGDVGDFDFIDLEGKIAVIARGNGVTFSDKASLAVEAGAVGTIIYNNESGSINMDLTAYPYTEPVVAITRQAGAAMRAAGQRQLDDDNRVYYTGRLCIKENGVPFAEPSTDGYYTMSDFSSWGTTGDLALKPELTAPGGGIFSVKGDVAATDQYKLNSGTSMASPQVAGAAALTAQFVRESGLAAASGHSTRQLVQSLLMSTAVPMKDENGQYYPVLRQGAGLIDPGAAVSAGSYILMDAASTPSAADGKVKAELGDDPERTGVYELGFTIYNTDATARIYVLSAELFTQDVFTDASTLYPEQTAEYAALSTAPLASTAVFGGNAAGSRVTVPAGGSAHVTVSLQLTADAVAWLETHYPKGTYMQGYVFAAPEADGEGLLASTHSIPLLAFYGNWGDPSMFCETIVRDGQYYDKYLGSYTYRLGGASGIHDASSYNVSDGILGRKELYVTTNGIQGRCGGNPLVADKVYHPERDAVSTAAEINYWVFPWTQRDVALQRNRLVNLTTGESYYDETIEWEFPAAREAANTDGFASVVINDLRTGELGLRIPAATREGDRLEMTLYVLPEYYAAGKPGAGEEPGAGATLRCSVVLDGTPPHVDALRYDPARGELKVTASDERYIAAAAVYTEDGSRLLSYVGAREDLAQGEAADYTVSIRGAKGGRCLLQIYDYALNAATYYVEVNEEGVGYSGSILAYDLDAGSWVQTARDSTELPARSESCVRFSAAAAAGEKIYGVAYGTQLYSVSLKNAEESLLIGDTSEMLVDLAWREQDGFLYGVTDESKLVRIDPATGRSKVVGDTPVKTNTLACGTDGTFYSNEYGTGRVYAYTVEAAQRVEQGLDFTGDSLVNEADVRELLRCAAEGRSPAANAASADLDGSGEIDVYDAALLLERLPGRATLIASTGAVSKYAQSMAVDPNNGRILWASYSTELLRDGAEVGFSILYEIDPVSRSFEVYRDVDHQLCALLVLDKDVGSVYPPLSGIVGIKEDPRLLYSGLETGGSAAEHGVDNSGKAAWLATREEDETVALTLRTGGLAVSGLYELRFDPAELSLAGMEPIAEHAVCGEGTGLVRVAWAQQPGLGTGAPVAILRFRANGCAGLATLLRLQENALLSDESQSLDLGGHAWGAWSVTKEPSCQEPGERLRVCTLCGKGETEEIPIDPDGHSWGEWQGEPPDGPDPAPQIRTCALCGGTDGRWVNGAGYLKREAEIIHDTVQTDENFIHRLSFEQTRPLKAWELSRSDGTVRYLVMLSKKDTPTDSFILHMGVDIGTGADYGRAIKSRIVESVGWDADDADHTLKMEDGLASLTVYSYYDEKKYTPFSLYFCYGDGELPDETTYEVTIPDTMRGSAFYDGYIETLILQTPLWPQESAWSFAPGGTLVENNIENELWLVSGTVWLNENTPDDAELKVRFKGGGNRPISVYAGHEFKGGAIEEAAVRLRDGQGELLLSVAPGFSFSPRRLYTIRFKNYINEAPALAGAASGAAVVKAGETLSLDLSTLFTEPDQEAMSYTVALDGGAAAEAPEQYAVTFTEPGVHSLVFTAHDEALSSPAYTLTVTVKDGSILYGDADGSGRVNSKDLTVLKRYLAHWENVTVDERAADVNGDGKLNGKDATVLSRYLAGWVNVTLGPGQP